MKTLNKFLSLFVVILLVAPVSLVPSVARADDTGFKDGSVFADVSFSDSDSSWTDVDLAQISDDHRAKVALEDENDLTDYLKATGFGFAIPADSTINGIEVSVEKSFSGDGGNSKVLDNVVRLVKDGSVVGDNKSLNSEWTTSDNYTTYGGSNDKWGQTWSVEDINNANFGVVFSTKMTSDDNNREARVDHIRIKVYYSAVSKINICHFTGNPEHWWEAIRIDQNGWNSHEGNHLHDYLYEGSVNSQNHQPDDNGWCETNAKATLTLVKNVSGGEDLASAWTLSADGPTDISGVTGDSSVTNAVVKVGTYTLSESSGPSNYLASSWSCTPVQSSGNQITLTVDQNITCTLTNDYDVCPNIAGAQATVPKGKQIVEGQCVDISPQCNSNVSLDIVSDLSTQVDSHNAVPLTYINSGWTASIPGATWIWATNPVESPTNDADLTKVFTKTFNISGTPTSGTLLIATDNSYSVKINGNSVPVTFNQDNFRLETQDSYDVSSMLVTGSNTIEISVTNWEVDQNGNPASNPAGLLYKLEIKSNECPPTPTIATISATKIVCDNESDLPNWGSGDSTMQQITSNTASRYVNAHPSCHIVSWTFEWAPNGASNPGDNTGVAGGAWTSFTSNATIPAGALAWVREEANSDYVPFSGDTNGGDGWDAVSAEMYCNTDVLNYDNYDFIDPVVAGQTYYCVAFNVLKNTPPPPPSTSIVKVCKLGDGEQPLAGWDLMLLGDKYGSISVNPNGNDYTLNSVPAGNYVLKASGTYVYRPGNATASTSDPAYSLRLPSDSVYGGHYVPWVRENDFPSPYTGWLGIIFDNSFTDWGSIFNPSHVYALGTTTSSTKDFSFKILDDQYADNSGSLNVDVYNGYNGVTGQDGCVTFSDVPYGTYSVDEIMKDNWSNVSGLGEVTVNDPTEHFNVVNHDDTLPPAPVCDPNIDLIKNGSFENNIVSNPEKWNIFASGTTGLDWLVEWFGGSTTYQDATRPEPANIELHNGVNGWLPSSVGSQYTELDSDWFGPSNPLNGEPASIAISQDTATIPGLHYELKFDFSPRPNTVDSENVLGVLHNGEDFGATIGPMAGSSNTDWHSYTLQFTATSTNTLITFRDAGTPNSVGTFLDNVSLRCVVEQDAGNGGGSGSQPEVIPTDVCLNMEGVQISVPEDRELKDGQCVLKEIQQTRNDGEGEQRQEQPLVQTISSGGRGNGPVNFGFVNPGGGNGMVFGASTSKGEVLGDSCTPYITTYMRAGKKNNPEEVKKLQTFLNEYLGLNIPVTGYFGNLTRNGVNQFQVQEGVEVLSPWVKAGLHNSEKEPTGYVYKTTQRRINLIKCISLDIPVPSLP